MTTFNFNSDILEQVASGDTTENKLVHRTAQRIADKGFELLHAIKDKGAVDGFRWGRSSHGTTRKVIWEIAFENDAGQEFVVNVALETTTYESRNPYDRLPKSNGQTSATVMATDETLAVLKAA